MQVKKHKKQQTAGATLAPALPHLNEKEQMHIVYALNNFLQKGIHRGHLPFINAQEATMALSMVVGYTRFRKQIISKLVTAIPTVKPYKWPPIDLS